MVIPKIMYKIGLSVNGWVSFNVLCNKKIPLKFKGRFY